MKEDQQEFATGAVRNTAAGKPLIGNISPFFLQHLGDWLAENAEENGGKYPMYNWEKGIPVRRCYESLMRHLNCFARGKTDEPHLAAAGFNIMLIDHVLTCIDLGLLPAELDDRVSVDTWNQPEPISFIP